MKETVLTDSYVWIEYFSGGPLASQYGKYIEPANREGNITAVIILYEVYKRLKLSKGETIALKAVAHIIEHTTVIAVDEKIALNAADISLNQKLGMADAIIKATAESHAAKLITSDEHFKDMDNVVFIK